MWEALEMVISDVIRVWAAGTDMVGRQGKNFPVVRTGGTMRGRA